MPKKKKPAPLGLRDKLINFETEQINNAMRITKGNATHAARRLQISLRMLHYKFERFEIDPNEYRS